MTIRYVPLDEVLDKPAVRLLRALRFFDSITSEYLLRCIDLTYDERNANAHTKSLERLARAGFVAFDGPRCAREYRITDSGRRHLARELRRGFNPQLGAAL